MTMSATPASLPGVSLGPSSPLAQMPSICHSLTQKLQPAFLSLPSHTGAERRGQLNGQGQLQEAHSSPGPALNNGGQEVKGEWAAQRGRGHSDPIMATPAGSGGWKHRTRASSGLQDSHLYVDFREGVTRPAGEQCSCVRRRANQD